MRQRASLCRSIIHKPDVLILDEPFRRARRPSPAKTCGATMHDLRREEPFTCLLITHDLRESVFLARPKVVVMSGRPAHAQYVLDVDIPGPRGLDDLYAPKAVSMLATLRHQIQVRARAARTEADAPLDWSRHPAGGTGMNDNRSQDPGAHAVHRRHPRPLGMGRLVQPAAGFPHGQPVGPDPRYIRFLDLFLIKVLGKLRWRTVAGLGLAVIFGTLIGMIMGFSRFAARGALPDPRGLQRDPQGPRSFPSSR